MKTRSSAAEETPAELVANLRSLIAEAEKTLGEEITEAAGEKLGDLHGKIEEVQARIKEYYGVAREKVVAGAKQADATIRSHPYESLAVALGVGVLIGALIRRK